MKFVALFIFSTFLLGSECINLRKYSTEIIRDAYESLNNFIAPVRKAQVEMYGVYDRAKTNYYTTGSIIRSADDCLKLTNSSEQAYSFAVNVTNFGVAAVKELGDSMNDLINCATVEILKQLNCVFDKLQIVRDQVIELQQQFTPYLKEGTEISNDIYTELQECL